MSLPKPTHRLTPIEGYTSEAGAHIVLEEDLVYCVRKVDVRVFQNSGGFPFPTEWTVEWCEFRKDAKATVSLGCDSRETAALVASIWVENGTGALGHR